MKYYDQRLTSRAVCGAQPQSHCLKINCPCHRLRWESTRISPSPLVINPLFGMINCPCYGRRLINSQYNEVIMINSLPRGQCATAILWLLRNRLSLLSITMGVEESLAIFTGNYQSQSTKEMTLAINYGKSLRKAVTGLSEQPVDPVVAIAIRWTLS